jgi:hypothetical protein
VVADGEVLEMGAKPDRQLIKEVYNVENRARQRGEITEEFTKYLPSLAEAHLPVGAARLCNVRARGCADYRWVLGKTVEVSIDGAVPVNV